MSLSICWHAAKDNYCFLPTVQIILKVHSLMTLMKAITVGISSISELPTAHNGRHTERGNTLKTKGQPVPAIKTLQAGHGWQAKTKAACHHGVTRPENCHWASCSTACSQAGRFPLPEWEPLFSFSCFEIRSKLPLLRQTYPSNCPFIRHPVLKIFIRQSLTQH